MFATSISLSYVFLGISIISVISFIYFKSLYISTSPNKKSREDIIGSMKDPLSWRNKNNKMSYLSFFWFIISLAIFIYLKYFHKAGLISMVYMFVYIAIIVISIIISMIKNKSTT